MADLSPVKPAVGRTAFITGGAQGIGRAISCRLARDGFDISIADIASQQEKAQEVIKEIGAYGRKGICVVCDVRDPKQIEAAITETVAKLGPNLFVSVANAGIVQVKSLLECDLESMENMVRVNVLGLMNTHIYAARQMIKQGTGGRILGAGSRSSYRILENTGPYGTTKFAVRGFTEAAAKEWGRYSIRVNAYAPAIVNGPMWDSIDAELAQQQGVPRGSVKAAVVKRDVKLGRIQEPEDVAKLVSFLVSDEGEYITGQTIKTCGGASL